MDVVDDDTLAAVITLWSTNAGLPQLIDAAPQSGRLVAPQSPTYAQVTSKLEKRESAGTAGAWHDYRKVTVVVRGVKANVVTALTAIGEVFNRDCVLVYPSGARFIRWWPSGDGGDKLEQDDATKAGDNVWVGTLSATVWSIRLR